MLPPSTTLGKSNHQRRLEGRPLYTLTRNNREARRARRLRHQV
jgi:hypothetical protein